jgi:hypothetical protein
MLEENFKIPIWLMQIGPIKFGSAILLLLLLQITISEIFRKLPKIFRKLRCRAAFT